MRIGSIATRMVVLAIAAATMARDNDDRLASVTLIAARSGPLPATGKPRSNTPFSWYWSMLLGALFHYTARTHGSPEVQTAVAVFAALAGSLMVSYTRARAEAVGTSCEVGLTERPERMVILIIGALFGAGTFRLAIWVLAVLSHFTAIQRIRHVLLGART